MSYVVLATLVDEVDIASGYFADGVTPHRVISRTQGTVFTPQGGNAAQVTRWVAAGAVVASASAPTISAIAPTHAAGHSKCALAGTVLNLITAVSVKLTAAGAAVPPVYCQMRETSATSVAFIVPSVPAGAYTVTAWIGTFAAATIALTVDAVPT